MSKYKGDKSAYLMQMADREWPKDTVKAFKDCNTKVRHSVSIVIIVGNSSDKIAKSILEWVSDSKPIVVYKGGKNG